MNISSLLNGFTSYLEELNETSNKNYNTASSNVSIFMYSTEFKNYISDELNVDPSIFSKSVSEILSMEVVNGKLVEKEDKGNNDSFINTEDTTLTDTPDETGEINTENADGTETGATEETVDAMTEILNNLFEDSAVIEALDTDKSGDLNQEEIASFLNSIKGNDGNADDISFEDIISGIESIKQDNDTENSLTVPEEDTDLNTETQEAAAAQNEQTNSASANNTGSTGGSSSGGNVPSVSTPASSTNQEKNLEDMNLSELQEAYSKAETERDSKQSIYDTTKADAETAINASKDAEDKAYDSYLEGLKEVEEEDENFSEQVEQLNTQINDKEDEIHQRNTDIADKKTEVSNAEHALDTAQSTLDSLDAALSALQATDTSNMDDSAKADLQSKIAELTAKRDEAEEARDAAQEELDQKETELDQLENGGDGIQSLADLEAELSDLEQQMTELEAQILEAHPEIEELLTAYQEARQEHSDTINDSDKAIAAAQKNLEISQKELDKIDTAIQNYNTNEIIEENSMTPSNQYDAEEGERLVDVAKKMLETYGSSTGYCATGVSRTISMAYGIQMGGNGCDWDTNMEKLVEQGMFAEVTGDYASSSDLTSLPAGAVVCWEATGGTNGGGAQYGHVTIADGNGGEISDHYSANIYQTIGGRSDTYRVFIPIS